MQYSPKLKKAMQKIQQVLDEEDIAGFIVLHEPGFSETLLKVNPKYSCAKLENGGIRVKAKAAEFEGGADERNQKLKDTCNMVHLLALGTGNASLGLIELDDRLSKALNATHDGSGFTSIETQNN